MESDLYAGWLPDPFYYIFHLIAWMAPVVGLQWAIGWKIFLPNLRAILWPPFWVGTYLIFTDVIAVHFGIWHFDPTLILSGTVDPSTSPIAHFLLQPLGVPLEEWIFFYLTALLCSQSFVLFLPERYRHSGSKAG